MSTLSRVLVAAAAIALSLSSASAGEFRMTPERAWQFMTSNGDVFTGPTKVIYGAPFTDGKAKGLVALRHDYGHWHVSITDVHEYHCPNVYIGGDVTVLIWFSSENKSYETKWTVSADGSMVETHPHEGDALVAKLRSSPKAVFRVIDGCDSVTDYPVTTANLDDEIASFNAAR